MSTFLKVNLSKGCQIRVFRTGDIQVCIVNRCGKLSIQLKKDENLENSTF